MPCMHMSTARFVIQIAGNTHLLTRAVDVGGDGAGPPPPLTQRRSYKDLVRENIEMQTRLVSSIAYSVVVIFSGVWCGVL